MTIEYVKVNDIKKWKISNKKGIEFIEKYSSELFSTSPWLFLRKKEYELYDKLMVDSLKLGPESIAETFTGIQSSADAIYVIEEWKECGDYIEFDKNGTKIKIEKKILKQYLLPGNINKKTSFKSFETKIPDGWIIFPYLMSDGEFKIMSESILKDKFSKAFTYLDSHKTELGQRKIKVSGVSQPMGISGNWWRYGRQFNSFKNQPKIIVGVLGLEGRYIYDESDIFFQSGGTAGYVGISMKKNSQYSIYYILGLLNHKALQWVASKIGSNFQGGYISRGQPLLKQLPIKKINFKEQSEKIKHDEIVKAVQEIIKLHKKLKKTITSRDKEKIQDKITNTHTNLEKIINRLYDIESLIQYTDIK